MSEGNQTVIIIAVALISVSAIAIFYAVTVFNRLIIVKNNIKKSWANIDVLLQQRTSELSKLIDTVSAYMQYEKNTLELLTKARTSFSNAATKSEKAETDHLLTQAFKTLFAVAENYPQLKANASFIQLQERISGLETEIADRREFYNDSVNNYNIRIQSFPDMLVASMLRYKEEEMFKVPETAKQDIKINVVLPRSNT